jgi:hypothetical protein
VRVAAPLAWGVVLAVIATVQAGPTSAAPTQSPVPSPTPTPTVTSNPFPSPSPTSAAAGANGYFAVGYGFGSASGGEIAPLPGSTAKPASLPSSQTTGFWADIAGRLGPSYVGSLSYENDKVSGGDHPFVSYAQLDALYQPRASSLAFGAGFLSAQRSTVNANMNAFGPGLELLPNTSDRIAPYFSAFFYLVPQLRFNGSSSSLLATQFGFLVSPKPASKVFLRLGGSYHCCFPSATSPRSDFTGQLGLGSSF